jgi:hypothetical protein
MKSSLAHIGETELSSLAAKLEQAGRDKDTAMMSTETGEFLARLRAVIEKLTPQKKEDEDDKTAGADYMFLREKLLAVKEACKVYNKKAAKDAIAELRQKTWERPTKELLGTMSEHLLSGDFEEVSSTAEKILGTIHT